MSYHSTNDIFTQCSELKIYFNIIALNIFVKISNIRIYKDNVYIYKKTIFQTNDMSLKVNEKNYVFDYSTILNLKCFVIETNIYVISELINRNF